MGLLYFFGLFMVLTKSDASVTWTTPAEDSTAACPTLGTVPEGTTSGTVVTSDATATNGDLVTSLVPGGDSAMFAIAAGVVTIASNATLDLEEKTSYTVLIEGKDDDSESEVTATCTIAVTDVAPWFDTFVSKLILPASTPSTTGVGSVSCTDGAGSPTLALTSGDDDTPQFAFNASTGDLTKSAALFDVATKATYTLTFTCVEGEHTATATMTVCLDKESNCPSSNKASINHGVLAGLIVPTLLAIYHLI